MKTKWMCTYAAVLAAFSLGCFYSWDDGGYEEDYSYEDDYYSDDYYDDDYHADDAIRQALTAPAPEVSNAGYDPDAWSFSDCQVHAQCPQGEVCASDPACPDYLYCYPKDEAECDCADRFNTVCWFGECVLRGVDCDGGCPDGSVCEPEVGACIASPDEPNAAAAPAPAQPDAGEKCLRDDDCTSGTCDDGTCAP